jgi:hypothetical protein
MGSEILHEILINGIYSRLDQIKGIITPSMNLHTFTLDCELQYSMSPLEDPREIHVKQIVFAFVPEVPCYTVIFKLMHNDKLKFTENTLELAFDKAISAFGWGRFRHLIPNREPH